MPRPATFELINALKRKNNPGTQGETATAENHFFQNCACAALYVACSLTHDEGQIVEII